VQTTVDVHEQFVQVPRVAQTSLLVGSADIQSLADLGNSFEVVKAMRVAPITRDALLGLCVAVLAPIVPLMLTMMSPEELVKKLVGVLF